MLSRDDLKSVLHELDTSTNKALVCLAVDVSNPKSVAEIKALAQSAGEKSMVKSHVHALLQAKTGIAIHTNLGWELSPKGQQYVKELIAPHLKKTVATISRSLRDEISRISSQQTKEFVEEAVKCFECGFYRAAVVLSWIGAIGLMHEHIMRNRLADFNSEAQRRNPKWKAAKTADDLANMKESDFLDILEALSMIGKSVKLQLVERLNLRNGCGHPNSLMPGENVTSAHIESLINHVFSKFS